VDPLAEQLTPLQEAAHALHELFTALVGAEFNESQALYLVGRSMIGADLPDNVPDGD
jgi:hypothetical protein